MRLPKWRRKNLLGIVLLLGVAGITLGQQADRNRFASPSAGAADSSEGGQNDKEQKERIREGTRLIDRPGYFRATGDRAMFYSNDGEVRFRGLENLALERVVRTITAANDRKLAWSVTGTVTEFRGSNFLLITRAILKTKDASISVAP